MQWVNNFRGLHVQRTLRPAQQEAGAGLAEGKLARRTAQRSPSAVHFRCLGDSESEFLTCLSWRVLEISMTGARIQSCATGPSSRGIRPFVDMASIQSAPAPRIAGDWRCGRRASGSHVTGATALPTLARPGVGLPGRAHVPMIGRAGHTRLGSTPSVGGGRCPEI
jgi:hypothetical protein